MVHYVLDTGFFILSRDYYPDVFPTFWDNMNEACQQGIISSVDEVKKELEQYGGEQKHLTDWIKSHSTIFTKPDNQEQENIKKIFEIEWQSFRTKKDRSGDLKSVWHKRSADRHKIAVKVVDVFGNDTMKVIEVMA